MKVAILGTNGIPARYGGFETFAEELSVGLVREGVDVTVFCVTGRNAQPDNYKGVRLEHVPSPRLGPLTTILYDLRCMWQARRNFDIVYMLGYGAGPFFWIPRVFGRQFWVNMDGLEWKRSKWPWYGKLYLRISEWFAVRSASLVVADAEGIRDYIVAKYGEDVNCHTIPYGAKVIESPPDVNLIRPYGLKPSDYYLVVCRLEPENHVKEIIGGFRDSGTKRNLVIIGDSRKDTPYVRELSRTTDDRIRFLGAVYDRELLEAFRYHAFAYFHGHSVGGTNPSLLEALGCGNVVIAHDNLFNREVAADCAFYFSKAPEIPGIIESLEIDANRHSGAQKARDRIRREYTWDNVTLAYQGLIQDAGNRG